MWTLRETARVQRDVPRLSLEIRVKYETWKDVVRFSGPDALRAIPGYHDEALRGSWAGHRSSRLNRQYRVIYRVVRAEVTVDIERVSAHDYRR